MAEKFEELFSIWKKKQASYGSSNISALGVKGVFVRMWDKLQRLKNLVWHEKENPLADETLIDTYMDMANYAVMSVLVLEGKWPEYKDNVIVGLPNIDRKQIQEYELEWVEPKQKPDTKMLIV